MKKYDLNLETAITELNYQQGVCNKCMYNYCDDCITADIIDMCIERIMQLKGETKDNDKIYRNCTD